MYYATKRGQKMTIDGMGFDTYGAAKRFAEERNKATGHHYDVVEVKTVWTTKNSNEAIAES